MIQLIQTRHWLTREEAADYCRCSLSSFKEAVAKGELRHAANGRPPLYTTEELDGWIRTRMTGAPGDAPQDAA